QNQNWLQVPKRSLQPLPSALTVFTDADQKSRKAATTWKEKDQWHSNVLTATDNDSLQTLELWAVVWVFCKWVDCALNVVTDSLYVAGIVERIEDAEIKDLKNKQLVQLLI
ncbi:PO113 protein, partial [Tachuris rubrigastra]|nr:PO113 protein [Tachuris rubrigastra]